MNKENNIRWHPFFGEMYPMGNEISILKHSRGRNRKSDCITKLLIISRASGRDLSYLHGYTLRFEFEI